MEKIKNIFVENLEPQALAQFESAMEQDFAVSGALMPDAHTGYSLPIGAVIATRDMILPSWVGYDIGCGMCALKTPFLKSEVIDHREKIFNELYRSIPVGFNHNKDRQSWDHATISKSARLVEIFDRNGLKQLGTLGGGNHFIEIGSTGKDVWIIIHSGSRGIGHAVATHYMKLASGDGKAREGHYGFDTSSENGEDYITDMDFCLAFALENRRQITEKVFDVLLNNCDGWSPTGENVLINRNHNHAEVKDGLWIHRKGATHAEEGMDGVIPGNMRDGSFIVKGKGNPDSLWSSSHGAGRVMSRTKAKESINMDDFKETMKGITAMVKEKTLDESPFAYKDIFKVMELQEDFVEIIEHVEPIINVKG